MLMYEITGYDRQTGHLAAAHDVPARKIAVVKKIAGIASSDDGLGSYPLDSDQMTKIAKALKIEIEQDGCDFFLGTIRSATAEVESPPLSGSKPA